MRKSCLICGKGFDAPPSGARTCSHECACKLKSRSHTGVSKGSWQQGRAVVERNLPSLKRHAAANLDRIMSKPGNRRGPQHHASELWVLRDPAGAEWRVTNLRDWARTHAHLFGQEDGEAGAARVCSGIQQVKQSMLGRRHDPVSSYKGWTLESWSGRADQS